MLQRLLLVIASLSWIACSTNEKASIRAISNAEGNLTVSSPDGKNVVQFMVVDGKPLYSVSRSGEDIINTSRMGFTFKGENSSLGSLELVAADTSSTDETWQQVWGEEQKVRNHFNQLSLDLREASNTGRKLRIEFRAFDDGIAFRYIYPQQGEAGLVVMDELTEFNLPTGSEAWWIPAFKPDRDEFVFTKSDVSSLDTVHTPLTIKTDQGVYLSIHEARLVDFTSITLVPTEGSRLKTYLVPWADGDRVKTDGSFTTPWRTLQIADTPGDLITSNLILNLNDDNVLSDVSWIKPHKYLGIWWGMHIGKFTFWESPTHGASTKNAFLYIDYCEQLGIDHLLIEGWNKGWTPDWYKNQMHMFSFTEATEDFDLKAVTDYAKKKGVKIIGYHETGSNIDNYLKQVDDGMKLYQSVGINDIKIGQVGSLLNMKEWHYGQFGVKYYRDILKKAGEYKLAVNFHEPIKDTGERRTYPNMLSREGARGQEYNAWSEGNPPAHTATLPFTRLLSGPMDYTPGIFDVGISQGYEGRDVHSTLAKELSLYVVFYSPIQMLADLPENYVKHPAFKFLQDVPVDWEETRVVNAAIGEYVTTVRKDRHSNDWYLGTLTNEEPRTFKLALSFLDADKQYEAQIYADAEGISWKENAEKVTISKKMVTSNDTLQLNLAPGGGTAIRFAAQ
jgi:alpha-glucosidase